MSAPNSHRMKERERGFLNPDTLPPEVFDYVRELHDYFWRVVRAVRGQGISGDLSDYIPGVVAQLEAQQYGPADEALQAFLNCPCVSHELAALQSKYAVLKNAAPQEVNATQEGRSRPPAGAAPSEAGAERAPLAWIHPDGRTLNNRQFENLQPSMKAAWADAKPLFATDSGVKE